jgi:hypothetical protein
MQKTVRGIKIKYKNKKRVIKEQGRRQAGRCRDQEG